MKVSITYIKLKSPLKIFKLISYSMKSVKELSLYGNVKFKTSGFWTKHYTMTLWNSEDDIKKFARNGAHKEAIKISSIIASEIRTTTIELNELPSWQEAKKYLLKGKVLKY